MICLPLKDPNQYDLFDPNINFVAEPSTAYPPNMQDIIDELKKPGAFKPSPNEALLDELETTLSTISTAPGFSALPQEQKDLLTGSNGGYNFAGNTDFNPYTGQYSSQFPPLLGNSGSLQDIINVARMHIYGIPTTVPGAIGSLGNANVSRTFGYVSQGNSLQRNLGLGAIPDCGLIDALLGMLAKALQPLIDLLAALLAPLINLLAHILAILAAILGELLKLLNLAQQILDFISGSHMLNLDPCALLYLAQGGSKGLNDAINEGIKWRHPNLPTIPDVGIELPDPPPQTLPPPPPQ